MKRTLFVLCMAWSLAAASAQEPPLVWVPPASFDPEKDNLGLPPLPGVRHETIYDPEDNTPIVTSNDEPSEQGWLNHHAQLLQLGNHLIVTWTSHLVDENAPGQRILARTALIKEDGNLAWSPSIVEIAPPPVQMEARGWNSHADVINGPYVVGRLMIIGGKLYFSGSVRAYDGWTNEARFHGDQERPIPQEHYQLEFNRETNFRYDIRRDLKLRFFQEWEFRDNELQAASPLYITRRGVKSVEVTPGLRKPVIPLNKIYQDAASIDSAPESIQRAVHTKPDIIFERPLPYQSGKAHIAADGHNGLAHWAEYQRPDGQRVVIRDNLENRGHYYAAVRPSTSEEYPPAVKTNLFGDVDPEAGELPDGRVWLIGNDYERVHFYLTLSKDGIHFDRTWLLNQIRLPIKPGLGKTGYPSGPQYPQVLALKDRLVVVYSVGKQRIDATTIPLSSLE